VTDVAGGWRGTTPLPAAVTRAVLASLAAVGATWLLVVALVLGNWALVPGTVGAGSAFRFAGLVWLLAQHVSLLIPGGRFSLAPLGLTLLPATVLTWAGWWAARGHRPRGVPVPPRTLLAMTIAMAASSACCGELIALLAAASGSGAVGPDVPLSWLGPAVLTLVCGGAGAVIGGRSLALPSRVKALGRAAVAAGVALLGGAALVAAVAVAARAPEVTAAAHGIAPDWAAAVGLFCVQAVLLPNLLVWTLAYVTGPGFAVGAHVGPLASGGGAVPGLPLLTALPVDPPAGGWAVLAVPVLAGVLLGVLARRALVESAPRVAGWAALAAVPVGGAAGLVAAVAGGAVGGGRLAAVGPSGWLVGGAVTAELAAVSALAVLAYAPVLAGLAAVRRLLARLLVPGRLDVGGAVAVPQQNQGGQGDDRPAHDGHDDVERGGVQAEVDEDAERVEGEEDGAGDAGPGAAGPVGEGHPDPQAAPDDLADDGLGRVGGQRGVEPGTAVAVVDERLSDVRLRGQGDDQPQHLDAGAGEHQDEGGA
jgi:hypothetical protein